MDDGVVEQQWQQQPWLLGWGSFYSGCSGSKNVHLVSCQIRLRCPASVWGAVKIVGWFELEEV